MNKLLILLLLIISVTTFSQEGILSNQKNGKVNTIYDSIYPEGRHNFRQKFYEIFARNKVNGKGITKSEATFIVTSEGKITDIKATGINISMNNEMERTIKEMARFRWNPKELNGKPVDSKYSFPITITFVED
ncbi:energy transducer TonB [Chryseobacterium sp. SSA4.19]|uniref:energy transducer TonB n=1 Tax=Chryseobacterium sp. SSA4.19 TaxID=2919915 RepID=UPI001F4DE777|nr:energy transducer TonB [Chryseobacterium sp. SSA4.19]MCJ8152796.1 energy transducer TonB [Chryseobacterium sp. SSA4.19]